MASANTVCPYCGSMQALPKDPNAHEMECDVCGEIMHLSASGSRYEVPDDIALDGDAPAYVKPRAATRYFKKPKPTAPTHAPTGEMQMSVAGSEPQQPAQPLPQPRAAGDPDKKLVAYALGMLRFRGCPCTELPGYRAFVVKVGFRHHELDRKDICNVTVAATGGLLTLETIAMPLPSPPWLPLRKTLNLLNRYAGGCLFLLRECGIVVRMKIMPRGDNLAVLEVDELLQALRQLNHERNLAMMALFTASRQGHADFAGVRHAFNQPLAEGKAPRMILDQLADLAQFAGYYSVVNSGKLYLNTQEAPPSKCPVRFEVEHGVAKGYAELGHDGDTAWLGERMNFVRGVIRNLVQNRIPLTEAQTDRLLERMNTMNDNAALLRYIWHDRKIYAMNIYTPLMRSLDVEQFRLLADALFRRAKKDGASSESGRRAV